MLVDGLGVALHRAIVAAREPFASQARGHVLTHGFGDLDRLVALVHQAQRLIVQPLVHVALLAQVVDHALMTENRPGVLADQDLGVLAEALQGLVEVLGPGLAVADFGTAQGQ
ncbi:hypothetical protein D9M68_611910 [compost metagenome]